MDLPSPRLQLRWRSPTKRELNRGSVAHAGDFKWTCEYELVLPLGENDIRRTKKHSENVVRLGRTFMSTGSTKFPEDAPFRDGVHAKWDSAALGGIPIYIISPSGKAVQYERE